MTADGQGVFMESQRKRPSASRRASSGGQLSIDPKPVRPKLTNPRLTCDSVSSMLAAKPPVSQAALLAQAGAALALYLRTLQVGLNNMKFWVTSIV